MKKLIVLIIFSFISCASNNDADAYKIMDIVVEDLKDPYLNEKLKSIDLVNYSSCLNKEFVEHLRNYMLNRKQISSSSTLDVYWASKNDEFILSEYDMKFMIKELSKNNKIKWDINKLNSEFIQINLFEYPNIMDNCKKLDEEREKRIKNKSPLFLISAPIFNKSKKIAILKLNYVYLNITNTYIFKSEKGKWKLIGRAPYSL